MQRIDFPLISLLHFSVPPILFPSSGEPGGGGASGREQLFWDLAENICSALAVDLRFRGSNGIYGDLEQLYGPSDLYQQ